jgi:hypothetical protein
MSEPIRISPDSVPETNLWTRVYIFAMRAVYDHEWDIDDLPEFAAKASDRAVLELRKRFEQTDRVKGGG